MLNIFEADRQLDALVYTEVFHGKGVWIDDEPYETNKSYPIPEYSTDIEKALWIFERMETRHERIGILRRRNGVWRAEFFHAWTMVNSVSTKHTAAHAICIAALLSLRDGEEECPTCGHKTPKQKKEKENEQCSDSLKGAVATGA